MKYVRQRRQIAYDITYVEFNFKYINELTYKTETDSQFVLKTKLQLPKGKAWGTYMRGLGLTYTHYCV